MEHFENHAYTGTRHTSMAAAEDVLPKTGTQRWEVYQCIKSADFGRTADESMKILGMPQNSLRKLTAWNCTAQPRTRATAELPVVV